MASDPTRSAGRPVERAPIVDAGGVPAPESIARRVPFANNPTVGQRGRLTQQRIVAAALQVFGEGGYHTASVADLAKRAGCSRVAFYQYFSSKEDVLRYLAGQVARQVGASVEAMGPLTPDAAGWTTIREWVERYADIYEHFGAVFHVFESAARETLSLKALNVQAATTNIALIRSRLTSTTLAHHEADAVIGLLLGATARTYYSAEILRHAAPRAYPRARVEDALADVIHRAFFGLVPGVNAHGHDAGEVPFIDFDRRAGAAPARRSALTDAARATYDALLSAGYEVFNKRGYHGARVDDVAAAAGLSHGIFYRYFANKADLARTLVLTAMTPLSSTLAAIPTPPAPGSGKAWSTAALRDWLRTYNETQVSEAGIIRIWVDATLHEAVLGTDAAAALDWGRRQLAHFLAPRGFGDVDAEAIVAMALLDVFGGGHRSAETLEAAVHVLEGGLLGQQRAST
ncbi:MULTISPECIES: TetR/AcrR family transcriptional regulator [unclassified Pseudofrankia]|uniref:TetR/AcrR family transcriptional regulator n=1 Tax=unclassified Pseudofrankia TaxID=2994372 RepID=UPI0009F66B5C|nr:MULTISPECIES: TetR/AcrR family transcriptional regulator [unclassified Pseudofrankia]MDT3444033.1 TetR/AcrR family transcriptional regulator [Pseudofrankia sp. BMG5.37]